MTTKWRDFEQLVARIEETLAPKGAIVKSPDRIRDMVSGRMREVDASIRFDVGSTPILITVECRRRRGVQDDTWIEQLATKRQKIGAAKTIAVSATGFSDSATRTALLHAIELRTLEDRIEEEIVQQFLSGFKISMLVTDYSARTIAFQLEDGSFLSPENFGDDLLASIKNDGLAAVVAKEVSSTHGFSIDTIMRRVDDSQVPEDGRIVQARITVTFAPRAVQVSTKTGPQFIRGIEIVAEFSRSVVPMPATALYEYATPDKSLRHTIDAVGKLSEHEGVRMLVDISSPTLDRAAQVRTRATPAKRKGRAKDKRED